MHYVGLLIATFFPPVIVALLNRGTFDPVTKPFSPKTKHTGTAEGFPGWTDDKAGFYHAFDILIVIKISLAIILIYSVQYTLNRAGANSFESSGTITITVGADSFTALENPSGGEVEITLSDGGSSIKKYKKPEKPPEGNLTEIGGTGEPLTKGTKLEIDATGRISEPSGMTDSEVTIKGNLTVTSDKQALSTAGLTLSPDPKKDPSSQGLSGTITPQGTSNNVTISGSGSTINLTGDALAALKSLTKNAVTLTASGTSNFKSSASITISRGEGSDVNFKSLDLKGGNLEITSINGTIKKYNNKGHQEALTINGTTLTKDTQLSLEASGQITQPVISGNTNVNLEGTIVVTNKTEQSLGQSGLTFGGGPGRSGVGGSLTLQTNGTISAGTLTITSAAYNNLQKTTDTLKIGASESTVRKPTAATGAPDLNNEDSFKKYWHLLPSDMYDKKDLPDPTVVSPTLMVIIVATIFPPMIVVILQITDKTSPTKHSPKAYGGWNGNLQFWHLVDLLIIVKISLAAMFIYSLYYRESNRY